MNLPFEPRSGVVPLPDTEVSQVALFRTEYAQVEKLAATIKNNRELRRLLLQISDLEMREAVYKLISTMVKFKPRSYKALFL